MRESVDFFQFNLNSPISAYVKRDKQTKQINHDSNTNNDNNKIIRKQIIQRQKTFWGGKNECNLFGFVFMGLYRMCVICSVINLYKYTFPLAYMSLFSFCLFVLWTRCFGGSQQLLVLCRGAAQLLVSDPVTPSSCFPLEVERWTSLSTKTRDNPEWPRALVENQFPRHCPYEECRADHIWLFRLLRHYFWGKSRRVRGDPAPPTAVINERDNVKRTRAQLRFYTHTLYFITPVIDQITEQYTNTRLIYFYQLISEVEQNRVYLF